MDTQKVAYKHAYNASMGIILGYFAYGSAGLLQFFVCAVYSYLVLLQLSKKPKYSFISYRNIPFLLLGVAMAHLGVWYV